MNYYQKYLNYKIKYDKLFNNQLNNQLNNQSNNQSNNQLNNQLNNQSNNQLNNQLNNQYKDQYEDQYEDQYKDQSEDSIKKRKIIVPKYVFSNERSDQNIYKWNDILKRFEIVIDSYIYLSSSMICVDTFNKDFSIENCKNNTIKMYEIINTLPDDNFVICINYTSKNNGIIEKDFQIGLTESLHNNENIIECTRRGIIEEIGLHFTSNSLSKGLLKQTYDDKVICFINKLSDLENIKIKNNSELKLFGGNHPNNIQTNNIQRSKSNKLKKVKKIKTHIFLYDTLDKIISFLSNRYTDNLIKNHYLIDNFMTITDKKLLETNKEKNNLEIYTVSVFDLKTMLLKIHNKDFN